MQSPDADVIVVGTGTMGSAALWRLAGRGVRVIGIEQYELGHDRGSGHGESRLIRTAYFEHPSYVPLVQAAWQLWRELEAQTRTDLLTRTGALMIGPPGGELVKGALAAAAQHTLPHTVLNRDECAARFPQHLLGPDDVAVLEPDAGILRPEDGIRAMAAAAAASGAQLLTGRAVRAIEPTGAAVAVHLDERVLTAPRVVVCAGAWAPVLLPALAGILQVERQIPLWFRAVHPDAYLPSRFPVFVRQLGHRFIYGIPTLDGETVKVGLHHGGAITTADTADRTVRATDRRALGSIVGRWLPGLDPAPVRGTVCLYTNSPDGHFVVGPVAAAPGVVLVSACSGHGYKFAPIFGEIVTDLVLDGDTDYPIGLFDPARLAGEAA